MAIRSSTIVAVRACSAVIFAAALTAAVPASATEGGLGRPVSGTGVQESAGIVPDVPIWAFNLAEVYQSASIGGGRQVPIIGELSAGIDSDLSLTMATLLKVWDTGPGQWNYASSISVPYVWMKVTAHLDTPGTTFATDTQSASNLFDLMFTPFTAGYHISKTEHVSFSLNIWAPTGQYDKARLANPSLNNWTFIPTVAYTNILAQSGFEFDASLALQFYTRNGATDYQNAPLLTLDLMMIKRFASGFAAGIVGGWVQQLAADTGKTADRLNGFEGYDISIGPYVSYSAKIGGKLPLAMALRWVPTVASRNRLNGDAVMASMTAIF
jgi:hypothetical protein